MSIFITQAENTALWDDLTIERFRTALLVYRPDATISAPREVRDYVRGGVMPWLEFTVPHDDTRISGTYYEGIQLSLDSGQAAEWAPTAAWFLGLLPPTAPAVCFTEQSQGPHQIPRDADVEEIGRILANADAE